MMPKIAPPCRAFCPAGVNVQGYITLAAEGKFKEALELIREDNPFPSVCGRVCLHPCEAECHRAKIDDSVAINAIKLFIAKQMHKESIEKTESVPKVYEEKIAVIGSGPAGLSAAYFLAKKGYPVTVLESLSKPGGKLRVSIPEYRLPREELDFDIHHIQALGVEVITHTRLGKDIIIENLLHNGYKAIFIAVGAHKSRKLGIEGEDLEGIIYALDFLKVVNFGEKVELGENVAVIGGGNAAIDSARTALRLGAKVQIFSILPRNDIPGNPEEVKQAEMEGARIQFLVTPKRVLSEGGRIKAIEFVRIKLGTPDELGRKRPLPIEGSEFTMEFDTMIIAIGEDPESIPLPEGVEVTKGGTITADPDTMQTELPYLFAGGDVVTGTWHVLGAIAAGKKAANSIDCFLRGKLIELEAWTPQVHDLPEHISVTWRREEMPLLSVDQRSCNFSPVELGFSQEMLVRETARCMKCGHFDNLLYKEVISQDLCTACGTCVGVCPVSVIEMKGTIPELVGNCAACGWCYLSCPGKEINIQQLDTNIFGRTRKENEMRIGIHLNCYAANSSEKEIRYNATSGGVITSLLLYAFDHRLVDGAIVTGINEKDPTKAAPLVATSREEILRSQKAKYMLVPGGLLSALREALLEKNLQKVAIVGSPCHIHAVRKLQLSLDRYQKAAYGDKIAYTIGLYCAFNFFPEGTATMIQALGIPMEEVKEVGWRDTSTAPFPGKFCVTTKSGDKRCLELIQEYIILGGIYDHPRCRICYDWANEVADISSGDEVDVDSFHKAGAQRSHTVVRTKKGEELFNGAMAAGYLEVTPISEEEVARNVGFIIKKIGNIPRIEERRKLGLPLPKFGNYPFYNPEI